MKQTLLMTTMAGALAVGSASAMSIVMVDPFGDGNVLDNTDGTVPAGYDSTYLTEITDGGGSISETGSAQTYNPGGGNWTRSELHSNHDYANPSAGGSLKMSWTVGNILITGDRGANTDGQHDYRVQLNAISNNRPQGGGAERWLVTEGALSLDLFFNSTNAAGEAELTMIPATKNATQAINSDGSNKSAIIANISAWDFVNTTNTFTLEISPTGYSWSDDLGIIDYAEEFGAAGSTLAAVPAEFANGYWAHISNQNNDTGRGTGVLTEFRTEVTAIPEPSSALISLLGLGLLARRRR